MNKLLNPPDWPVPATYSHGFSVPSSSRTVYVAGQIGVDPKGNVPAGIAAQTRQALENIRTILRMDGMDMANIVKTTVFLIEPSDFTEFGKTRSEILGATKPASTLVYIKQLIRPEFLVEIEAIAVG